MKYNKSDIYMYTSPNREYKDFLTPIYRTIIEKTETEGFIKQSDFFAAFL